MGVTILGAQKVNPEEASLYKGVGHGVIPSPWYSQPLSPRPPQFQPPSHLVLPEEGLQESALKPRQSSLAPLAGQFSQQLSLGPRPHPLKA